MDAGIAVLLPQKGDRKPLTEEIKYCFLCTKPVDSEAIHFIEGDIYICKKCQILAEGDKIEYNNCNLGRREIRENK